MRHKSFDNFLITSMSLVALLSIFMLYGTKLVSFNTASEMKVASIVEQLKTVKRKRDFYQGWVDVKPGDGLSQNDEIYTHGQSSAKIRFTNGPEISLFENSLLRIKTARTGSTFSLDKGNLIAKLSKDSPNLDIELNGKKYSFKSENANIQIEQGKNENKFLLLDGKARLADQEILPNQVVIQNILTGKLQIKEIPFIPKLPLNNKINFYLKTAAVNFSWTYTALATPLKIIVAKDSEFHDIVHDETLKTNSHSLTFADAGTYYWKLSTLDKQENVDGPIRSFTLIEEIPPILSPDQTIIYKGPKFSEKVYLNWSRNSGKKFLVKIETAEGKIQELITTKNNFEFKPEIIGNNKIMVKVNDDNRPLALWSVPVTVTLKEAESIVISGLTPEFIEKVNYKNETTHHLLSWNGPNAGVNYKILIKKDQKILELETEQTSIPINLKEAGEYQWEIYGETLSGVLSNKLTGKILIRTPLQITQLPSEGAVIELDKPDQLVAFKWDQVDEATQYQFELADDPTFKKIIVVREVLANNISTSMANTGRYFWRVKIKRGDKIEFSNPVSVEIRPSPPLERPEDSPDIKIKLKYLEEKSSSYHLIDFFFSQAHAADQIAVAEWDLPANPRAKNYIVEIYKDPEFRELVIRIETEIPHVVWKDALAGTFYWRVSYRDFWGRNTEFSKVSMLSTEAFAPQDIELKSPKHHAEILKLKNESTLFEWEIIRNAKSYNFLISTDLEFENIVLKKQVTQNEILIDCQSINNKAGEYYWKVYSGDSASKRRQFEVTCEAPPEIVVKKKENEQEKFEAVLPPEIKYETFKKQDPHFFRAGLFIHHLAYQNKAAQYWAKVDGNVLDSFYLMYQTPLDMRFFQTITPSLWISRGKVFKAITFTDGELNVKAHRLQPNFSWGPVAAFMKKTLYIESNLAIIDEGISTPLIGAFIQKEFNNITMDAEVKMGTLLNLQAGIQYRLQNNLSLGVIFDSTSITKDNNKHSFSRYGLNINYTFDLLDATE